MGLRFSRWMFSTRAIWAWVKLSTSRSRAGMVASPASLHARQRRLAGDELIAIADLAEADDGLD